LRPAGPCWERAEDPVYIESHARAIAAERASAYRSRLAQGWSIVLISNDRLALRALAQADLDEVRLRIRANRAWFARTRIVVLPDRCMRRFGGAAAIYQCVCVGRALLQAPPSVRRAIIAHEWGHIAAGHCNATITSLALLVVYGAITATMPTGLFWPMVNLALLTSMAGLVLWSLHPTREFEADAIAAQAVGAETVAQALRWIVGRMRDGKFTPDQRKRLRRLETYRGAR
jgi:hypothetical protein